MEFSSLENENDYKSEKIYTFVQNVTPSIIEGYITEDNPSPSNGLNGLEQVILFGVEPYMDEIYDMDFVKARITVQKAEIEKTAEELLGEDDEEEWKSGSYPEDPDWREPYINDHYYGEYIDPADDSYYKIDDPAFKKKIRQIAIGYQLGTYTDDNHSKTNGLTGVGQVISYASELLYPADRAEKQAYFDHIRKMVKGYLYGFRGGSKLSLFGEDLRITVED